MLERGNSNKNCAIFNYWWAWRDAHGASLTALALYKLVEELGFSPCLIMTVFKGDSVEKCRRGRHFRFIGRYAKFTEENYITAEEYERLNDQFQYFILGSDQVLRVEWVPDEWFFYSIRNDKTKIIMSGSFGTNVLKASKERLNRIKKYLDQFSAISLRELDGIEVYNRYFGKREDIEWIMDPVFLIDPVFYYQLINNHLKSIDICSNKDIIFFYILDITSDILELRDKLSNHFNVIILEDDQSLVAEDFLYIVANCKMVITDSYHGMCFSIIFNKPFYCIYNRMRGISRVDTIKEALDLSNVIIPHERVSTFDFIVPTIDYTNINEIIKKERKRGRDWLEKKLKNYM